MSIKYYIERNNLLIILILMVVVSLFFSLDKCILYLFELDFLVVLLNSLIFVGVFLKFIWLFCDRGFLFYWKKSCDVNISNSFSFFLVVIFLKVYIFWKLMFDVWFIIV